MARRVAAYDPTQLPHPRRQRGVERLQQLLFAERLDQDRDPALSGKHRAGLRIRVSGDENDRQCLAPPYQLALQFRPGHSRHRDIEDQTAEARPLRVCKIFFGGGECRRPIAELSQQIGQGLAHRLIIINDCNVRLHFYHNDPWATKIGPLTGDCGRRRCESPDDSMESLL